MDNVGFPPDSREPAQQAAPQGTLNLPPHVQQAIAQAVASAQPAPAPVEAVNPAGVVGSLLQTHMGNDLFFEWIDFCTTQSFHGLKFDEMDRMDLLAMCGHLIGELYKAQAVQPQPATAPSPGATR